MSEPDPTVVMVAAYAKQAMVEAFDSMRDAGGGPLTPFVRLRLKSGAEELIRVKDATAEATVAVAHSLVASRAGEIDLYAIAFTAETNGERYDFTYRPISHVRDGAAHPAIVVEAGNAVLKHGQTLAVHATVEPDSTEYADRISGYGGHPNLLGQRP